MLADEAADSDAEETEADASEAALLTSSTTSAREAATAIRTAEAILWKRIANGNSLSNSGTVVKWWRRKQGKEKMDERPNCRILGGSSRICRSRAGVFGHLALKELWSTDHTS